MADDGLRDAVRRRGGVDQLGSLHTRNFPGFLIEADLGVPDEPPRWSYALHICGEPRGHRPVVERETVRRDGKLLLERPAREDRSDPERLTETHLEQVVANASFREVATFFRSIRYLHLVPQIVRESRGNGGPDEDPYGSDLLNRMGSRNERTRNERLKQIRAALRNAVPQFEDLELERDGTGKPQSASKKGETSCNALI